MSHPTTVTRSTLALPRREARTTAVGRVDPWIQAAFLAGLALRLVRLDAAPLWLDEVITVQWLRTSWGDMLHTVLADNHPPLYFVLLKAWAALVGMSPWALRLPSVLASAAVVALVGALGATLCGRTAGRWSAWLAAVSPILIHHAQETRMYAFVGAFAAAHLLVLARFLTGRTRVLGIGFVASAAALVGTHYYGTFLVAAAMAVLLLERRRPVQTWAPAWIGCGLTILGAVLSAAMLATHRTGGSYQPGLAGLPGIVWAALSGYALMPDSAALHRDGSRAILPYLPLAAPALIALALVMLNGLRTVDRTARLVLGGALAATLLAPFAVGVVLPGIGLNPRYALAGLPALLALVAAGAVLSPRRLAISVATLLVAGTAVVGTAVRLAHPIAGREDVQAAGRWLDANVAADEEILIPTRDMVTVAAFHWPQRTVRLYPAPRTVVTEANAAAIADALPFSARDRAIYVLGRAWDADPQELLPGALRERYRECGGAEVEGIRILCLTRAAR